MVLNVTFVEYAPTLAPILNTNTLANTPVSVVLNVTDIATSITNLIYSANNSNPNVIAGVNFSFNGSNEIATIVPATNKAGVAAITIIVSDGVVSVFQSFAITVTAPTPPTLAPILNVSTPENTPVQVVLSVNSPVTPVTNLTFSASSAVPSLVNTNGISFSFNGTSEVATITPVANATGVGSITISVSDEFSTNSQSFTLQVGGTTPVPPTLTGTLNLVNGILQIAFTGTPGATYATQSSSDLKTWTTVTTVTANAVTGAAVYNAAVSTAASGVFYRVESQ
jgi:hypothetical protein